MVAKQKKELPLPCFIRYICNRAQITLQSLSFYRAIMPFSHYERGMIAKWHNSQIHLDTQNQEHEDTYRHSQNTKRENASHTPIYIVFFCIYEIFFVILHSN